MLLKFDKRKHNYCIWYVVRNVNLDHKNMQIELKLYDSLWWWNVKTMLKDLVKIISMKERNEMNFIQRTVIK